MGQPQPQPKSCSVCHKRGSACVCGCGTNVEYGIFNDGGCIESGIWSEDEGHAIIAARYPHGDDYKVRALCRDHEEQPADACEDCNAEEST